HSEAPFEKLVAELRPERDLSRNPLFQVMFQLFTLSGTSYGNSKTNSGQMAMNRGAAMFDLAVHLSESLEDVRGQIEYSTDLFRKATVQRMAGHLEVVLEAMVRNPEQRLGELPLLTGKERHQVQEEWNPKQENRNRESNLMELFQEQ